MMARLRTPIFLAAGLCLAARIYPPPKPGISEIRRIAVDRQGFVWVSGDDRTYRFDGVRYLDAARLGLPDTGSKYVAVTSDGAVWAQSERMLWRLENGRFRFQPTRPIVSPIEAAGPFLWVNQKPLMGAYSRDSGGNFQWKDAASADPGSRLHGEPDGTIWFATKDETERTAAKWLRFANGRLEQGLEKIPAEVFPLSEVAPAGANKFYTGHDTVTNRYERTGPATAFRRASQHIVTAPLGSRLLAGNAGEIWYEACGQWISSTGRRAYLPGAREVAPVSGGLWGVLGKAGIAYSGHSLQSYSIPGFPDRPVVAMSRLDESIYVARRDMKAVISASGHARFCNGEPRAGLAIEPWGESAGQAPFTTLAADPDGQSIWVIGKNFGASQVSTGGRLLATAQAHFDAISQSDIRQSAFSSDGRLWLASKSNLIEVRHGSPPSYVFQFPGKRYVGSFARTANRAQLVAVAEGALLHYAGEGRWREQPLPDCLLSSKLRAVAIREDGDFWTGYRDREAFSRATRADSAARWTCRHFDASNGFRGDTQMLAFDRDGRLWRGSNAGLFLQRPAEGWVKLMDADGEMHPLFHQEPDGSVFIATGDRLLQLQPLFTQPAPARAPQLSYFENDGQVWLEPDQPLRVRRNQHATLYLSALDERELAAPAPIEYRFGNTGVWQIVRDHALPLSDAPAAAERIEFRYAGSSAVTAIAIAIEVPWWRTGFFGAAMAGLFAALAWTGAGSLRRWRYLRRKRAFLAAANGSPSAESADPGALQQGTLLRGRYRVGGRIAQSGFSSVYLAADEAAKATVVVKCLRLTGASRERIARRFSQEIASASMVQHPNIVSILDAWMDLDGAPHIVMPFIDGPTLRQRLATGPFLHPEAIELLLPLAEAISAAHSRGVIHSDLKPENIMLSASGPMVIDFGASALLMSPGLNDYSRPAGSLHYMAPEQLLGRYSAATDVYAFALIALEVLTGKRYVDIDLPMNDGWEAAFRLAAASELRLSPAQTGVFVDALRFDPGQRDQDIAAWMARLKHCPPGAAV